MVGTRKRKADDVSDASSTGASSSKTKKLTKKEKAELFEKARLAMAPKKTTAAAAAAAKTTATTIKPKTPQKKVVTRRSVAPIPASSSKPKTTRTTAVAPPPTTSTSSNEDEEDEEDEEDKDEEEDDEDTKQPAKRRRLSKTTARTAAASTESASKPKNPPRRRARESVESKQEVMRRVKEWAEKEKQGSPTKAKPTPTKAKQTSTAAPRSTTKPPIKKKTATSPTATKFTQTASVPRPAPVPAPRPPAATASGMTQYYDSRAFTPPVPGNRTAAAAPLFKQDRFSSGSPPAQSQSNATADAKPYAQAPGTAAPDGVLPTPSMKDIISGHPHFDQPPRQPTRDAPSPSPFIKGTTEVAHKIPESPQEQEMIHKLVLANCSAALENRPLPYTDIPDTYERKEAGQDYEDDEDDEENKSENQNESKSNYSESSARPTSCWWALTTTLAFLVGFLAVCVTFWDESAKDALTSSLLPPPCFIDNVPPANENVTVIMSTTCDSTTILRPCPKYGRCQNGLLVECDSKYHEIASSNDTCVLSLEVNETKQAITKILEQRTIASVCRESSFFQHEKRMPFFPVSSIFEELEMQSDLFYVQDGSNNNSSIFVLNFDKDGLLYASLKDKHTLKLPISCWLMTTLIACIAKVVNFFWGVFETLATYGYQFTKAYPMLSLLGLLIVLSVRWVRGQKMKRKQLVLDIARVRGLACEKLQQNSSEEHAILHIRDAIAWEMFPLSRSKRNYIIHQVWPKVVFDLKHDNRIRKGSRIIQGKPKDIWQWVAKTRIAPPTSSSSSLGKH